MINFFFINSKMRSYISKKRSYKSKKRSYKSKERSYKRKNSYIKKSKLRSKKRIYKKSKLRSKKRIYKKSKLRGGNGKTGPVFYDPDPSYNADRIDGFMNYARSGEEREKLIGDNRKLNKMFPQEEFVQKFVKSPEIYNKDGSLKFNFNEKSKKVKGGDRDDYDRYYKNLTYKQKERLLDIMRKEDSDLTYKQKERLLDIMRKEDNNNRYNDNEYNEYNNDNRYNDNQYNDNQYNGYTYEQYGDPSQY